MLIFKTVPANSFATRQTLMTDYYKPISVNSGLFGNFDKLLTRKFKTIRSEFQTLIAKPKREQKQSLITDYYFEVPKYPKEASKKYITDYFKSDRAPQDCPI